MHVANEAAIAAWSVYVRAKNSGIEMTVTEAVEIAGGDKADALKVITIAEQNKRINGKQ